MLVLGQIQGKTVQSYRIAVHKHIPAVSVAAAVPPVQLPPQPGVQSLVPVDRISSITDPTYTSRLAGSSAKFTAPSTAGTLIFRLTVTDQGTNISSWDELSVTVQ